MENSDEFGIRPGPKITDLIGIGIRMHNTDFYIFANENLPLRTFSTI
jgi:hypothetical protein